MPPLKSPHKWDRWLLFAIYMVIGGVGVIVLNLGLTGMLGDALGFLYMGWAAFLIVGGFVAAAGQLFGRWLGELVGLPALAAAFVFIAVVLFILAEGRFTGGAAIGGLLIALTGLLLRRWLEVQRDSKDDVARHARGG